MGKKRECPNCKKEVEIIELIPIQDEPGHFRQMLSCGHSFKFVDAQIRQTIPLTVKLEALVIKYKSLEGLIFVSGVSGTSVTSGSYEASFVKGDLIDSNVNINQNNYNYELNMNTAINNLTIQNVLSIIKPSDRLFFFIDRMYWIIISSTCSADTFNNSSYSVT
ncbi:MAG: hypothetical protein WAL79_06060 [Nitrososphaeraceae archaeon]